jgi:mRNA-degrading endonuclease RelE of RelBE toxin-antitoxin system
MAYRIVFAQSVKAQLEALPVGQRRILLEAIEQQLTYEPSLETRNRKRLRPNRLAPWELRVGRLRAFYDVVELVAGHPSHTAGAVSQSQGVVQLVAVGEKKGNDLRIAGKKIDL